MKLQFQVLRDGSEIFQMDFVSERWQLDEFSLVALTEFHKLHPDILLQDEDVIIKWSELQESD